MNSVFTDHLVFFKNVFINAEKKYHSKIPPTVFVGSQLEKDTEFNQDKWRLIAKWNGGEDFPTAREVYVKEEDNTFTYVSLISSKVSNSKGIQFQGVSYTVPATDVTIEEFYNSLQEIELWLFDKMVVKYSFKVGLQWMDGVNGEN